MTQEISFRLDIAKIASIILCTIGACSTFYWGVNKVELALARHESCIQQNTGDINGLKLGQERIWTTIGTLQNSLNQHIENDADDRSSTR